MDLTIDELQERKKRDIKCGWLDCEKFNWTIYNEFLKMKTYDNINFDEFKIKLLNKMNNVSSYVDPDGRIFMTGYNKESINEINDMSINELTFIFNDIKASYFKLIDEYNKQILQLSQI